MVEEGWLLVIYRHTLRANIFPYRLCITLKAIGLSANILAKEIPSMNMILAYMFTVFMFLLQLDSVDTYSILVYGAGTLVFLWLSSAVVGAIDSIPVVGSHLKFCFFKVNPYIAKLLEYVKPVLKGDGSCWSRLHNLVQLSVSHLQGELSRLLINCLRCSLSRIPH